jgi:hypothetical protein
MYKFIFVSPVDGDWTALYVNDKLIAEGHSIRAEDILDAIENILPNYYTHVEISNERAEEGFPELLSELVDYNVDGE